MTYFDQVQFAKIFFIYHSPALFKPGDAEMDLVAEILAGGKSSRLYKRLVYEDKLATDVSAIQQSQLAGFAVSNRGDSPAGREPGQD